LEIGCNSYGGRYNHIEDNHNPQRGNHIFGEDFMKDKNLLTLGSVCAILLGIAKIASALLYIVMPANLRAETPGAVFLPAFAANPGTLLAFFWVEALVGVLGVAIIPALASLVKGKNSGWLSWSSNLAMIGYAVSSIGYLLSIARLPAIAKTFVQDPSTQAVLAVTWKSSIDLLGIWGYAAIGFWILVLSVTALQNKSFPGWLAVLGVVLSIPHLLIPIGTYFKLQTLLLGVAVVGLLLPIWYIGMGLHLRKTAMEEQS
jgi:hypothetical protein